MYGFIDCLDSSLTTAAADASYASDCDSPKCTSFSSVNAPIRLGSDTATFSEISSDTAIARHSTVPSLVVAWRERGLMQEASKFDAKDMWATLHARHSRIEESGRYLDATVISVLASHVDRDNFFDEGAVSNEAEFAKKAACGWSALTPRSSAAFRSRCMRGLAGSRKDRPRNCYAPIRHHRHPSGTNNIGQKVAPWCDDAVDR